MTRSENAAGGDAVAHGGEAERALREMYAKSAARAYGERFGWRVHPVHSIENGGCGCEPWKRKIAARDGVEPVLCGAPGKAPYLREWQRLASADSVQIIKWWSRRDGGYPSANVGVATGQESGIFVVDLDGEEGIRNFEAIAMEKGGLPPTPTSRTGSGGQHIFFRWPEGMDIRNTASAIASGVDVRGNGGYVVAPPSTHKSGNRYEWEPGLAPDEVELADAPDWLVALVNDATKGRGEASATPMTKGLATSAGSTKPVAPLSSKGGKGWTRFLTAIGDGKGLAGFDKPINQVACAYFANLGIDADPTLLISAIKDAVSSAPVRENRANLPRYLDDQYLNGRIEDAKKFVESQNSGQSEYIFTDENKLVDTLNADYAVVRMGSGLRILDTSKKSVEFMTETAARGWLAPYQLEVMVNGKIKHIPGFSVWMRSNRRREYDAVVFIPAETPPNFYNLYRGRGVEPRSGDWSLLKEHLYDTVCQGSLAVFEWLMGWMAQLVQEPQVKLGTAVFLRGEKGTGKSIVGACLGKLVGSDHVVPVNSPRMLTGNFNAHYATALLILVEEGFWAGDKEAEARLKDIVTNEVQMIERKGIDPIKVDSYVRLFGTSNSDWMVPVTADERRYCVVDVGNQRKQDTEFFQALIVQMEEGGYEGMMFDLLAFDYSHLDLRNPPRTAALIGQIEEGFDHPERWWHGLLRDGVLRGRDGGAVSEVIWELDQELTLEKTEIFQSYDAAVRGPGGRPAALSRWGKFMKKYAVGLKVERHGQGRERPYFCVLPPRRELQREFTAITGVGFEEEMASSEGEPTFYDLLVKDIDRMVALSLFEREDA